MTPSGIEPATYRRVVPQTAALLRASLPKVTTSILHVQFGSKFTCGYNTGLFISL